MSGLLLSEVIYFIMELLFHNYNRFFLRKNESAVFKSTEIIPDSRRNGFLLKYGYTESVFEIENYKQDSAFPDIDGTDIPDAERKMVHNPWRYIVNSF